MTDISGDSKVLELASTIQQFFVDESDNVREFNVFLCGGKSSQQVSLRDKLRAKLTKTKSSYNYTVYYPEELFNELLYGHANKDLIELENLLAESVSCVVLVIESAGSFVELGAFANHEKLSDKLVVVLDEKYRKDKSFINLGPVRFLKNMSKSQVIYHSFDIKDIDKLAKSIRESIRKLSSSKCIVKGFSNPIQSRSLYLAITYCFAPVSKNSIREIAFSLSDESKDKVLSSTETACVSLLNEGLILLTRENIHITPKGAEFLKVRFRKEREIEKINCFLNNARINFINHTYRKRGILAKSKF